MDVKTVMFAAFGLVLSGTATMVWVGHDMERIRAEERTELRADCTTAASAIDASASSGAATSIDAKLAERCLKFDIDLNALVANQAGSGNGMTAASGSNGAGAPGTAIPATNPGIAPDPTLNQASTEQPSTDQQQASGDPDTTSSSSTAIADPALSGNSNSSTTTTPGGGTTSTTIQPAPATTPPAGTGAVPPIVPPANSTVSAVPLS